MDAGACVWMQVRAYERMGVCRRGRMEKQVHETRERVPSGQEQMLLAGLQNQI